MQKIGFGGSCHWCTEAIFRSVRGIEKVEQGWVAPAGHPSAMSEAVIVHFDETTIPVKILVAIHLHTHSCTSGHRMRGKYRSAIYTFDAQQADIAKQAVHNLQHGFDKPIITQVLPFGTFKLNEENYLDYYYKDPDKPFCKNIVNPKLKELLQKFTDQIAPEHRPHFESL